MNEQFKLSYEGTSETILHCNIVSYTIQQICEENKDMIGIFKIPNKIGNVPIK